jgi:Uma2 family endonuclease
MQITSLPPQPNGEKRMTFWDLDWQSFQQIQQVLTERSHARLTYDNGVLEITMPLEEHERPARLIELFIRILVVEMGMRMKTMGSTTLDRADLLKSAEPDNGYYIQNYNKPIAKQGFSARCAGAKTLNNNTNQVTDHSINLAIDPPPDLVVEVDITHTDINKNQLYASMGVPEFWRFNGQEWIVLCLVDDAYESCDRSPTFPFVSKADLYQFLETALVDEVTAEINFRQWVKQNG